MPAPVASARSDQHRLYLFFFFLLFAAPLFAVHASLLSLPYFWDEQGQFIPTALDLLRHGWIVAKSTDPNVHPPGVEAYLDLWYLIFGYSIVITRIAMLLVAAAGLLLTFLLAIELGRGVQGTPAFWPPIFLFVSPLFFMQSFMAQLDMPAMVVTLWALLLFLKRRYGLCAAACALLVLVKETGIVTPLVFFLVLIFRRDLKRALYFVAPALALGTWLLVLHAKTGYWLGNPGFAHYNVGYAIHPVRMALSFARRLYYLFVAEFRWIGTAILLIYGRGIMSFRSQPWRVVAAVAVANIAMVSILGGAELERYLLPVLPLFYIATAIAMMRLRKWLFVLTVTGLSAGLAINLFWNPPYPFPFENNWAMVDFVHLQHAAAQYTEENLPGRTIATAWPFTACLRDPDFGYVHHPLKAIETSDFHVTSIASIPPMKYDALITYTRIWEPRDGVLRFPIVRRFLAHFYEWEPPIGPAQCERLGLFPAAAWSLRGQQIVIYTRSSPGVLAQSSPPVRMTDTVTPPPR